MCSAESVMCWRYWHGGGLFSVVTWWTHHCKAVLVQKQTQSNRQVGQCITEEVQGAKCVVVPYFQLPCCHPEGQLYDWTHSHAHRRRGVHLIPNGVTVHLQGAAGRFSSDTESHLLETTEGFTGDGLTPIPPQGRTAYIFWLIGPETANQNTGLGVLDELQSKRIK